MNKDLLNDKAQIIIDVIKVLIKRILFWCLKALAIILVLGYLVKICFDISNWYTYERHASKVEVVVKFDNNICSNKKFPLFVSIKNNSSRTVESINIYVNVYRHGHSTKLNSWDNLELDNIIKSSYYYSTCFAVQSKNSSYSFPVYLGGINMDVELDHFNLNFSDKN